MQQQSEFFAGAGLPHLEVDAVGGNDFAGAERHEKLVGHGRPPDQKFHPGRSEEKSRDPAPRSLR